MCRVANGLLTVAFEVLRWILDSGDLLPVCGPFSVTRGRPNSRPELLGVRSMVWGSSSAANRLAASWSVVLTDSARLVLLVVVEDGELGRLVGKQSVLGGC